MFPKLDGTNASIWYENEEIKCGSRNRELTLENDNYGFYAKFHNDERFIEFFKQHPDVILYGEYMVKHKIKDYADDLWGKFMVFDFVTDDKYHSYFTYANILDDFNIDYIIPYDSSENLTLEHIEHDMEVGKSDLYMKDGSHGEGVVIKNYDFINKFGETIWAKVVSQEFKTIKKKPQDKTYIENEIVEKLLSDTVIEKEYLKVKDTMSSKEIPRLLEAIYRIFLIEEIYEISNKYRKKDINLGRLRLAVYAKVKSVLKELFERRKF